MQGSNILPVGTILPFVGNLNKIPHGWYLCDGSNGTPDLQDKFLEGAGTNTIKNFIVPGLPNIKSTISGVWLQPGSSVYTGAFSYNIQTIAMWESNYANGDCIAYLNFDASKSNSIYGNSNTVQPAAYVVYYIMRIK